jgi:hypothetical protein
LGRISEKIRTSSVIATVETAMPSSGPRATTATADATEAARMLTTLLPIRMVTSTCEVERSSSRIA